MTMQRGVAADDLSTVADKLAIQELLGRYSFTYDAGDLEAWFNLWTDDGAFEVYMPTRREPVLAADGRDELVKVITTARASGELPAGLSGFHLQSLTVFDEFTPVAARIRTMVHATVQTCDDDGGDQVDAHTWYEKVNATLLFAGVYHSELAKLGNCWFFRKRVFVAGMGPPP